MVIEDGETKTHTNKKWYRYYDACQHIRWI